MRSHDSMARGHLSHWMQSVRTGLTRPFWAPRGRNAIWAKRRRPNYEGPNATAQACVFVFVGGPASSAGLVAWRSTSIRLLFFCSFLCMERDLRAVTCCRSQVSIPRVLHKHTYNRHRHPLERRFVSCNSKRSDLVDNDKLWQACGHGQINRVHVPTRKIVDQ